MSINNGYDESQKRNLQAEQQKEAQKQFELQKQALLRKILTPKARQRLTNLKMVRSDLASAGVMFTIDTESGFKDLILINSAYGLGENVVKGKINPDELFVYKPKIAIIKKELGSKKYKLIYLSFLTMI